MMNEDDRSDDGATAGADMAAPVNPVSSVPVSSGAVASDAPPGSRRALMLGAIGASAVLSIRPALAQTAGSVLTCEIPVPDRSRAGSYISADGSIVPARTPGAFAPANQPFKGEDVKKALGGAQLPGTNSDSSRAYVNYIRRLQRGQSGFTCFASLQMPRG